MTKQELHEAARVAAGQCVGLFNELGPVQTDRTRERFYHFIHGAFTRFLEGDKLELKPQIDWHFVGDMPPPMDGTMIRVKTEDGSTIENVCYASLVVDQGRGTIAKGYFHRTKENHFFPVLYPIKLWSLMTPVHVSPMGKCERTFPSGAEAIREVAREMQDPKPGQWCKFSQLFEGDQFKTHSGGPLGTVLSRNPCDQSTTVEWEIDEGVVKRETFSWYVTTPKHSLSVLCAGIADEVIPAYSPHSTQVFRATSSHADQQTFGAEQERRFKLEDCYEGDVIKWDGGVPGTVMNRDPVARQTTMEWQITDTETSRTTIPWRKQSEPRPELVTMLKQAPETVPDSGGD